MLLGVADQDRAGDVGGFHATGAAVAAIAGLAPAGDHCWLWHFSMASMITARESSALRARARIRSNKATALSTTKGMSVVWSSTATITKGSGYRASGRDLERHVLSVVVLGRTDDLDDHVGPLRQFHQVVELAEQDGRAAHHAVQDGLVDHRSHPGRVGAVQDLLALQAQPDMLGGLLGAHSGFQEQFQGVLLGLELARGQHRGEDLDVVGEPLGRAPLLGPLRDSAAIGLAGQDEGASEVRATRQRPGRRPSSARTCRR
jgi:hypothetical protein